MKRTLALTAAALATTLTLTACGGTDGSATPGASDSAAAGASEASGDFSDEDVTFAQMMIPHHAQAVEMSDVYLAKDDVDEDVSALAEEIKAAQAPEIEQMTAWLEGWDAEVPSMDGMEMGDDMGDMDGAMGGMMSPEDMQALEDATGTEASRLFLEQMTEHHRGAVEMAETELADGTNPDAKELAQTIIDTQEAEIEEMQDLLGNL